MSNSKPATAQKTFAKDENYGPRFLYAEDLIVGGAYGSPVVEISEVFEHGTIPSLKDKGTFINKRALKFKGKSRYWAINTYVEKVIQISAGEPFGEDWIGKPVHLQVRIIKMQGDLMPAIRALPPQGERLRKKVLESLGVRAILGEAYDETEKRFLTFINKINKRKVAS